VSPLVLTLKGPPAQRVDLSPLTPDRLAGQDAASIGRIELCSGNRRVPVRELFDIAPGDGTEIVIRRACGRLDFIGEGLQQGTIGVEGDAGAYLGQGMRAGRITVTGGVGPWAAAAMQGGRIEIGGDAGDFLGGALPGAMRGMTGGTVVVHGRAGDRAGDRMRRGVIAIASDVGAYAGSRIIAGTMIVLGAEIGAYPGFGMKRGTLLLRGLPERLLPTFADSGVHELGFLRLLKQALSDADPFVAALDGLGLRVRRFVGDAAVGGKGELLVWQARRLIGGDAPAADMNRPRRPHAGTPEGAVCPSRSSR
jgi:formylmethanofuran dehydrogenase subunit C